MGRSVAPLSRRRTALALAALVGVGAAAAVVWVRGEPASGSGYRITYVVEDLSSGVRTREVVEVDPPLRSRRVSGASATATTDRGVFQRVDGQWQQLAVVLPGEVGSDVRLTAALDWAASQGLAAQDGSGSVAGRACTWWLTREPLDTAPAAAASGEDRARSCVDDQGRLLADTWQAGGRALRSRTATRLEPGQRVDVFDGSTPTPVPPGLTVTAVELRSSAVDDLVVLRSPAGLPMLLAARSVEVEPGTATVVRRTERTIYGGPGQLVVVDQVRGAAAAQGVEVVLPGLGRAQVQATGGGLVLTVALAPEQALRIRSSLPYAETLAWLSELRRP